MKFVCRVVIDAQIEKVISLFGNKDNLSKWQDGFISLEHLEGTPGTPGAKSRLVYQTRGKQIELIETIIKNELPREFIASYEADTMRNTMKNTFSNIDIHQTEYIAEVEYTKFNGLIPKLMAKLFPGMFKKQTQKWLNQFKEFVENA